MKKSRNKKMKLTILILILVITIGYAILRTGLNINGTANIGSVSWDIYFDNLQATANSNVTPTDVSNPTSQNKLTTISYTVNLTEPGDVYEFTVDAVNAGTIDAMIESISSKLNNVEINTLPAYLDYSVTYSDGIAIASNQLLPHESSETLKVRVGYKTDIEPSELPEENQELNLSLTIVYVQADDNAVPVRRTLNLGDYVSMTPDTSTYTILGSDTGHFVKGAPFVESTSVVSGYTYSTEKYYCCSSVKPDIDQSTGMYPMTNMTRTSGNDIGDKYCIDRGSTSSTDACVASNKIYAPRRNPSSSNDDITTDIYTSEGTTDVIADQTITPSELNLWRVIDIHEDGTADLVSEYVSSNKIYFGGATGYANYVGVLQTIATQYAKSGYTVGTRMMGYDGQTLVLTDTSAFDGTSKNKPAYYGMSLPMTGTGQEYSGGVLGDTLYLKDLQLVGNIYKSETETYGSYGIKAYNVSTNSSSDYCLSSRCYTANNDLDPPRKNFGFGFVYALSTWVWRFPIMSYYQQPYDYEEVNSTWSTNNGYCNLRPIITLKSGIVIANGEGSKNSPYTLQ